MTHQTLFRALSGLLVLAITIPVIAQDTTSFLEEIVVTAQKREQPLSDVGIAVDVISGDRLLESGATSLIDVAQFSPGLNIRGPFGDFGYPIITLRGVNTDGFIETLPQSTGVYTDGVYVSQPPMLAFRLLDLERMEVLKGPQGTIYGRNTIAGAVNFIAKRPTREAEGYVNFGYGRYSRATLDAAYGGPISDTAAARGAVKYVRQTDSPLTNLNPNVGDGGEIDQLSFRGSLLFEPNDDLDILLQAHGGRDKSDVWPFSLIPGGADTDGDGVPDILCDEFARGDVDAAQRNCLAADPFGSGATYNDTDGDPYTNNLNGIGSHDYDSLGFMAEVNWDRGNYTITSVTGWDDFERADDLDEDAGPTTAIDNLRKSDVKQISEEIRVATNNEEGTRWLAGVYFSADELEGSPSFDSGGRQDTSELETDTLAVFGQAEIPLQDNLLLTVGGRWTEIDRDFDYSTNGFFAAPELQAGVSESFSDGDYSARIALDWRTSENTLFYGSISRGFNAGTYNSQFIDNVEDLAPTDSESILAYEVGVKSTLAGGRARLEAAAYYYDYQDIQVIAVVPRGVIDANILTNADDATLSGVEFQLQAVPSDWFDFTVGLSYIDSEFGNLLTRVSGTGVGSADPYNAPVFGSSDVQIEGSQMPNHPELSINTTGRVTLPVNNDWEFVGQLDFLWEDEIRRDLQGTRALFTDSRTNVDMRLGLESTDDKWDVALWARNLTDETYITEAYQVLGFGFYIAGANYNYPRTYGITVRRNF
ncbi:MAG: TonB-dependent receptor [Gammaproteobacteria bacterium]|nr:TonB-dependent receptor [Gammaproteobacteria bacterium]